jgi:hypothetical protein
MWRSAGWRVERGSPDDVAEACDVVARFETLLPPDSEPALQLWPLQCRARLADAVGDAAGYTETVIRYRILAQRLDARGHLAVAKQLATEPAFRSRARGFDVARHRIPRQERNLRPTSRG